MNEHVGGSADAAQSRFEGTIQGQRTFSERGDFQLNTGPLPGINPPGRWRMRDFAAVHVTLQGNLLRIATHLEIVPATDGQSATVGGNLSYVLTEEQRRIVAEIRGWSDE